jgi:autotransporter-associated beta strand protein
LRRRAVSAFSRRTRRPVSLLPRKAPTKTPNPSRFPATRAAILASACGLLATPVTDATFNWSRGGTGSFSWNNSTGVTTGESAPAGAINGNGTWTLGNGSNTCTGATRVSVGTLLVNGALGSTAVGVTGGTLDDTIYAFGS